MTTRAEIRLSRAWARPFLLVCLLARAEPSPLAAQEPGAPTPHARALLVGCDEYPFLRAALGERYERELALHGPAHDVALLRATLQRVVGLAPEHTLALAGWPMDRRARPTRANILAALELLAREAAPEDLVVVYLAGHGSQQRVQRIQPDEEPDGLEEIFLPADVRPAEGDQQHVPGAIRDDELGDHLRAIRDAGADVWLIVDSCHSGTMLRGGSDGVRLRGIDAGLLGVAATRGSRLKAAARGWLDGGDTRRIAALYGATSYGRAPEMALPSGSSGTRVHGLFTYLLCCELERAGPGISYRELADRVVAAYQAHPCSITVPTSEGDLERLLHGGRAFAAPLVCSLRDGVPFVGQGLVAGLEPGTELRLFALEQGAERAVGRIEIVAAELFEARGRLLEGTLDPGSGPWRARPEPRALGDQRLALALARPDGTRAALDELPARLRSQLEHAATSFPILADLAAADWWLVLAPDGLWLRPGPREGGFDLCDVAAEDLLATLAAIQRTRNLRRLVGRGPTATWQDDLELCVERRRADGWHPLEREAVLHPGDRIRLQLVKTSDAIYDVNVFFLDSGFGAQLLPPRSGSPRVPAGVRVLDLAGELTVTDEALGLESLLVFATPRTSASPVVDLAALDRGGTTRGVPSDPFEVLMRAVLRGERTRGEPARAHGALDTQSRLLTLRTEWAALAPPDWPSGGARTELPAGGLRPDGDRRPERDGPDVLPDPWSVGPRVALRASSADRRRADLLLLGGRTVEAVLIDLDEGVARDADPAGLVERRAFDAEAAVLFGARRLAFYDRGDRGVLDLALEDEDGDGVAETRWTLEQDSQGVGTRARWRRSAPVALPWLSQAHIRAGGRSKVDVTARFRALQRVE